MMLPLLHQFLNITATLLVGFLAFDFLLALFFWDELMHLRGLAQESSAAIRWEYAGPPEVESIIGGRSTVQAYIHWRARCLKYAFVNFLS
jgi:hypothetical protein